MKSIFFALVFFTATSQATVCNDSREIYKVCSDQKATYERLVDEAAQSNEMVLIKFGYHQCPWCQSLHKILKDEEFLASVNTNIVVSEIGMFRRTPEKYVKVEQGFEILTELRISIGKTEKYEGGYPLLALLNPQTGQVEFIETGVLEDNSDGQGHDLNKLRQAIEDAAATINKKLNE